MCGLGTVGGQLLKALLDPERTSLLELRSGAKLRLHTVSARRPRDYNLDAYNYTPNVLEAIAKPEIDVVIETIGGIDTALDLARQTLKQGKSLITANKDLLATHGDELFALARKNQCAIRWEAAVGGAIPVVHALCDGLSANNIHAIQGIINGTSNYVLSAMDEERKDFQTALKEAQEKGYAEADPSFDVDGIDAAHKLLLLAAVAWNVPLKGVQPIQTKSISTLSLQDMMLAREFGYAIKPLVQATQNATQEIELRVEPTLVPAQHLLAAISGATNCVRIEGDMSGTSLYLGAGAGGIETSSALLADLVAMANGKPASWIGYDNAKRAKFVSSSKDQLISMHYLRFSVIDQSGVLSQITAAMSKDGINVADVRQEHVPAEETRTSADAQASHEVSIAFITESCEEKRINKLLKTLQSKEFLRASPTHLHVSHMQ